MEIQRHHKSETTGIPRGSLTPFPRHPFPAAFTLFSAAFTLFSAAVTFYYKNAHSSLRLFSFTILPRHFSSTQTYIHRHSLLYFTLLLHAPRRDRPATSTLAPVASGRCCQLLVILSLLFHPRYLSSRTHPSRYKNSQVIIITISHHYPHGFVPHIKARCLVLLLPYFSYRCAL
jgi:hypothetical protein